MGTGLLSIKANIADQEARFTTIDFESNRVMIRIDGTKVAVKDEGDHTVSFGIYQDGQPAQGLFNTYTLTITVIVADQEEASQTFTNEINEFEYGADDDEIDTSALSDRQIKEILDQFAGFSDLPDDDKQVVRESLPNLLPGLTIS